MRATRRQGKFIQRVCGETVKVGGKMRTQRVDIVGEKTQY